jgi:hypothetical protein
MKKRFSIDALVIENGVVKILPCNDADLTAAVIQLFHLVKAGAILNALIIVRSPLRVNPDQVPSAKRAKKKKKESTVIQ